ncbi:putative proton-dependent oligopeptide transporter family, MFS transporter superfamily [Helianthus annuus]|nr:putative proton-dependent oligopeptide transporter family, MFS transporter superfamily [Helianthus annuus]
MVADKTMRAEASLLFSPGQLALAALRRANEEYPVVNFERYLNNILSRQHPARPVPELIKYLDAIDQMVNNLVTPTAADMKHIDRKLKYCRDPGSHEKNESIGQKTDYLDGASNFGCREGLSIFFSIILLLSSRAGKSCLSRFNRLEDKPLFLKVETETQCLADQEPNDVKTAKAVIRLLPIWTALLMFAVIFQLPATVFIKQGMSMMRNIGHNYKIPPATLQTAITISIVLMPFYDTIFIPFSRFILRNDIEWDHDDVKNLHRNAPFRHHRYDIRSHR